MPLEVPDPAPGVFTDFTDFAKAIDDRVLRRRGDREGLVIRIHASSEGFADPAVVVDALAARLQSPQGDALVPHALITDRTQPARNIADELAAHTPPGWGRLRFPQYELLRGAMEGQARPNAARDRAFIRIHPKLSAFGGTGKDARDALPWPARVLVAMAGPLARWQFGRRWRRRMSRGWFVELAGERNVDLFIAAEQLTPDSPQGRKVLLCALLSDLDHAFAPRISPWRRRRKSGFVLLSAGGVGDELDAAMKLVRARHVTVVRTEPTEQDPSGSAYRSLAQAANDLHNRTADEHDVSLDGVPPGADAAALAGRSRIRDRTGSNRRAAVEATSAGAVAMVVLLGGVSTVWLGRLPWEEAPDTSCAGRPVAGAPKPAEMNRVPSLAATKSLYADEKAAIDAANRAAAEQGEAGKTVKTVVYIGSGVSDLTAPQYSGAVPEIRGLRLAQAVLNEQAANDPRSPDNLDGSAYIRVEIREAGSHFRNAPEIARKVAAQSDRTVLGVIGLGESRSETLAAQTILEDGGLPMLGMGATSENLQKSPLYRQISWDNPRQARLAAAFVRNANIVADQELNGVCTPADRAIIIGDPQDDYSTTLTRDFAAQFPEAQREVYWFSQNDRQPPGLPGRPVTSQDELVSATCARLSGNPEGTVVYWPGRAEKLKNFLTAATAADCPSRFTVVTGADITLTATRIDDYLGRFPGVTVYFSAHALPSLPTTPVAERFRQDYGRHGRGDVWSDHWRAPAAFDGLYAMATAINTACRENLGAGCGRGSTLAQLTGGVGGRTGVLGATGRISYIKDPDNPGTKTPVNKRFLMLRDTAGGPLLAMECGYRDADRTATHWGTDGSFPCPST